VNRTWLRNGATQALRLLACGVFVSALAGCEGQIIGPPTPPGTPPPARALWLSYKYSEGGCTDRDTNCTEIANKVEENAYYCSIAVTGGSAADGEPIDCRDPQSPQLTLNHWKEQNGFPASGTPEAHAIYGNLYDLRIARDMNCVKSAANGNIACYVTNYGPPPFDKRNNVVNLMWLGLNNEFPGLTGGIEAAIVGDAPFATVAMVYNQSAARNNSPNAVTFYVFDGEGNLFTPALDGEGEKTNPRMCMACHGGTYVPATHSVTGAQFLPFDVFSFEHSPESGYTFDDQQEGYRKLNALVKETQPATAITDFIDGTYHNAVDTPGTPADGNYVPPGWSGQEKLYNSVYRQYCRMCHLASRTPFLEFTQFQGRKTDIEIKVCQSTDMPNAQVPFIEFWRNTVAQGDLRDFLQAQGLTDLHNCN
jgi:cytochrome c5